MHELLPFFVNRTLDPEESAAFERHLTECEACRKELTVLERMRSQIEEHGEAFLADHPSPEKLVALLIPGQEQLSADETAELRRHLALCATCAEEAAWIKGERAAESSRPGGATATGPRRVWPWAVAAAAAIVLAAFVPAWLRPVPVEIETGVVGVQFVYATQRAGGIRSEVRVPADATWFHFNIEVDALSSDFPLFLEITDADQRVVYRLDGIGEADLQGGSWLVICRRDEFPDGDYLARVRGSNPDIELIGEYPLKVTTRP